MLKLRFVAMLLAAVLVASAPFYAAAQNIDVISIIKVFGIGYAVTQFAGPLNDFINALLNNKGVKVTERTKVVPVLSIGIGSSSYIGAAQVSGPKKAMDKVKAVGQLEGDFNQVFRVKALVPIDSLNPITDGIRRVPGVGVTAIIDIRI